MNKEQVYDEKIAPLMDQIISICQERGVAMMASFAIPTESDPNLCCTTHLPNGEGNFHEDYVRAIAGIVGFAALNEIA